MADSAVHVPNDKEEDPTSQIAAIRDSLAHLHPSRQNYREVKATLMYQLGNLLREKKSGDLGSNQDEAIEAYQAALVMYSPETTPADWARIEDSLGNVYAERAHGDRGENLEKGIEAFRAALTIRTREGHPQDWARTESNLGYAYAQRVQGVRAENLEMSIQAFRAALAVQTQKAVPEDWAQTQNDLGNAYLDRIRGDRADNVEEALAAFLLALTVRRHEALPRKWAATEQNLGNAYRVRVRGERADNLEKAIEAFQAAFTVLTPGAQPYDWAKAKMGLGLAYYSRIRDDPSENYEKALEALNDAMSVQSPEATPFDWARTLYNIGDVYRVRIRGDQDSNLEKAIAAYEAALTIRTREALPIEWARTQWGLGAAYSIRAGYHADNLDKAIAAFQSALTIQTREATPYDWAMTKNGLGYAYSLRAAGEASDNIEKAIDAYQASLEVLTREDYPEDWAIAQENLGSAYVRRGQGERIDNLKMALATLELIKSVYSEQSMPNDWARMEYTRAKIYMTMLPSGNYYDSESAIGSLQHALTIYTRERNPQEYLRTQTLLAKAYSVRQTGQLKENLKAASKAYSAAMDTVDDLVGDGIDQAQITQAMNDASSIYRSAAFLAFRIGDNEEAISISERGRTRILNASLHIDSRARNLSSIQRTELSKARSGLWQVQRLLQDYSGWSDDPAANVRSRESLLDQATALRNVIRGLLPPLTSPPVKIPAPPVGGAIILPLIDENASVLLLVTAGNIDAVPLPDLSQNSLHELYQGSAEQTRQANWRRGYEALKNPSTENRLPAAWEEARENIGARLWTMLGDPLERALAARGVEAGARLIVAPQGLLSHLPFWLARNPATGETLAERYIVSLTPSLGILISRPLPPRARTAAFFNEHGTPPLPLARAARLIFQKMVPEATFPRAGSDKSYSQVTNQMLGARIWQFWTHAQFDEEDITRSGLQLARGSDAEATDTESRFGQNAFYLTVDDLMEMHFSDNGPELVVLSACESGLPDIKGNDELIGLPVALIQAGARGVVSTMWPVDEAPTVLLTARFHELRRGNELPASIALWEAQKWLRTSTTKDLLDYLYTWLSKQDLTSDQSAATLLATLENYRDEERPYADPYFWAGFTFTGSDDVGNTWARPDAEPSKRQVSRLAIGSEGPRNTDSNRFFRSSCGAIADRKSGLDWYVGPNKNVKWSEAIGWTNQLKACGKRWSMPSVGELRTLFDSQRSAGEGYFTGGRRWPAHIDPVFSDIGEGSWVWGSGAAFGGNAPAFNFNQGVDVRVSADNFYGTIRVLAVTTARAVSSPHLGKASTPKRAGQCFTFNGERFCN